MRNARIGNLKNPGPRNALGHMACLANHPEVNGLEATTRVFLDGSKRWRLPQRNPAVITNPGNTVILRKGGWTWTFQARTAGWCRP